MYGKSGAKAGANPYRSVSVDTASPKQRLLMLFDGAVRFSNRAKRCIEADDLAGKGLYVGKAQAIVQELQNVLRHDVAPELCGALSALYTYIIELYSKANLESDVAAIDEAIDLLATVKAGFGESVVSEDDEAEAAPAPRLSAATAG